ncbi:hypothetical protein JCM3765_006221 [Sporobolomyces pararoseus]
MPPKSKKGQKMDLSAFLADENTGGSWADEMDTLPTGPSAAGAAEGGVGLGGSHLTRNMRGGPDGPGGFGGRDRYDDGRPQRAEVPIPTEPPFTCFVGNLTFEVIEPDLEDFFTGLSVKSVRLVSGQDGKPRGFGYVEFNTVDDLKNALSLSGQDLGGRVVRISVAEAQAARTGRADEATSWERTGPLPSLGGAGRSGGFGARSGGFERREGGGFEEVEREGPIRGGKFVPSAGGGGGFNSSRGGREDRGPGFSGFERAPPVEIERDGPIRGGKFTPSQPGAPRRTFEPSRADEGPWTRGQALPPPPPGSERRSFGTGFGGPSRENSSSEIPIARRPLQLSARSASTTAIAPSSTPASPSASSTPRSNPFGAAKPIDTATKEKEVEEKLAKERLERSQQLAKEKEEKEQQKQQQQTAAEGVKQDAISKSDGEWVRKGPLPQRQQRENSNNNNKKSTNLPPPVPTVSSASSTPKDQPPHVAKPAWGKKPSTEEITKGVEETKI